MLIDLFLERLPSQLLLVLFAVALAVLGRNRLRPHDPRAATWLVIGMTAFAARWVLGALSLAYGDSVRLRREELGLELGEFAGVLALQTLALQVVLAFSIFCLWKAAVPGRGAVPPVRGGHGR